jgi:hypothetical protein
LSTEPDGQPLLVAGTVVSPPLLSARYTPMPDELCGVSAEEIAILRGPKKCRVVAADGRAGVASVEWNRNRSVGRGRR